MPGDVLLSVRGVGKSYATPVLAEVDLDLRPGEVHALVGENGAGKSTLSRILAGLISPDGGTMTLHGAAYAPKSRADAQRLGVRMVLQELNLVANLTVAESLFLEHLPQRWGWIDRRRLHAEARPLLEQVGLGDLDPATSIQALGVGKQQLVEIAAGLSRRCDLLILDEPTAALTDPEIELLFRQIARLRAAGTTVLYISHRMEEIHRIGDRVSVLRDGRLVATHPAREIGLDAMVRLMVGRDLRETFHRKPTSPGPVLLRVEHLACRPAVREVSFSVHGGEILGFAGLMGSGRTETMRAVCGADRPTAGAVYLRGDATRAGIRSPRDAVRQGLALLTENRKEQGLLLPWPIRSNLTLPSLGRFQRHGWIQRPAENRTAAEWVGRLGIRCTSAEQQAATLSGGNQQKVVIAKWLLRDCDILLFDEPTRGIDIGARFEIYQLLDRLAAQGKAIVVVSSDLPELLALCDRIAVMSAGRIAATFRRGEWTQEKIMAAALSGYLKREEGLPGEGPGGTLRGSPGPREDGPS